MVVVVVSVMVQPVQPSEWTEPEGGRRRQRADEDGLVPSSPPPPALRAQEQLVYAPALLYTRLEPNLQAPVARGPLLTSSRRRPHQPSRLSSTHHAMFKDEIATFRRLGFRHVRPLLSRLSTMQS